MTTYTMDYIKMVDALELKIDLCCAEYHESKDIIKLQEALYYQDQLDIERRIFHKGQA